MKKTNKYVRCVVVWGLVTGWIAKKKYKKVVFGACCTLGV